MALNFTVPLRIFEVNYVVTKNIQKNIKWGKFNSTYFKVLNGVHKGGELSTKLFAIYIDDLSQDLAMCKSGC